MLLLNSALVILTCLYAAVMLAYLWGFARARQRNVLQANSNGLRVAVIVSARNEADVIRDCIASVLNTSFPHEQLELIVVDDFSSDDTAGVVEDLFEKFHNSVAIKRIIRLSGYLPKQRSGFPNKKKAIEMAVSTTSADIIVTTDADCSVPPGWLNVMASQFSADPALRILACPVLCASGRSLLHKYQAIDFVGLMGITAAGYELGWHQMGNGANLAYRKSAFQAVKGFEGNEHIPSGDDMFLIRKINERWPGSARFFLSDSCLVCTLPKSDWKGFFRQRIRWGSKNAALPGTGIKLILLSVLLFCVSIWIAVAAALTGLVYWGVLLVQIMVKCTLDYVFLRRVASFFGKSQFLRLSPLMSLVHAAQISIAGIGSLMSGGRKW